MIPASYSSAQNPVDPLFANVSLLVGCDGPNGQTFVVDDSSNQFIGVRNNLTTPTVSNVQSRFGGSSLSLNASQILFSYSNAFDFGTDDYTVEFWLFTPSVASDTRFIFSTNTNSWGLGSRVVSSIRYIGILTEGVAWRAEAVWTPTLNQWRHIAVSRQSGTTRFFDNGVLLGSVSDTTSHSFNLGNLIIGTPNATGTHYYDDIRITKGAARYTASFSSPTFPFTRKVSFSDPDYITLFSNLTASYSLERRELIERTIRRLKTLGLWSKLDVLCLVGLNSADSLVNWKTPGTANSTTINSPTFTADRGFQGNGSSSYIRTNLNLTTAGLNYVQNSAHISVYSRTNVREASFDMDVTSGTNESNIASRFNDNATGHYYARLNQVGSPAFGTNADSRGYFTASRTSSTSVRAFTGGTLFGSRSDTSLAPVAFDYFIGAKNSSGSPSSFSTRQYSCWTIGGGLSDAEVGNLHSVINTYLSAIQANVV